MKRMRRNSLGYISSLIAIKIYLCPFNVWVTSERGEKKKVKLDFFFGPAKNPDFFRRIGILITSLRRFRELNFGPMLIILFLQWKRDPVVS